MKIGTLITNVLMYPKRIFGFSLQVFKFLNKRFVDFDWILVPVERRRIF